MDWMVQEQDAGITNTTSAATACEWRGHRINIIDTARARGLYRRGGSGGGSLSASLDGAVAVFDAVAGVEPSRRPSGARLIATRSRASCFINKMDRIGANFYAAVTSQGASPVLTRCPSAGPSAPSRSSEAWSTSSPRRRIIYTDDPGQPAPLGDPRVDAASWWASPVTTCSSRRRSSDDELMIKYLDGETLDHQDIIRGLRAGTVGTKLVPVLLRLGPQEQGVQRCSMPSSTSSRRRSTARRWRAPPPRRAPGAQCLRRRALRGARVQDRDHPFVGKLTFFPGVQRRCWRSGSYVSTPPRARRARGRLLQIARRTIERRSRGGSRRRHRPPRSA